MDLKELADKAIASTEIKADRSTVELTVEQRDMIDRAMERLRDETQQPGLSEGRCLEIICFDFVQSFLTEVPTRESILGDDA